MDREAHTNRYDRPPAPEDFRKILVWARIAALRRGVDDIEADEVAQVTVEKIWRRWDQPNLAAARARGEERWKAYVFKIALNTYRDLVRGHQRRLSRQQRASDLPDELPVERPGTLRPTIGEAAVNHAGRLVLMEMLAVLPLRRREIVFLRLEKGQTNREIAELLQIEPQTVRKHLREAFEELRRHLAANESV